MAGAELLIISNRTVTISSPLLTKTQMVGSCWQQARGWETWAISTAGVAGTVQTLSDPWERSVTLTDMFGVRSPVMTPAGPATTGTPDWTTCYDDVVFTDTLIDQIASEFCVDLDSVHQSGISNGGMFSYFIASRTDKFATIGPVAGAPLIGYGEVPSGPISVIDFHGINDDTIPIDVGHSMGEGPHNSVISWDGYYYGEKARVIAEWADGLECGPSVPWPTDMDGTNGWACIIHSGCKGGGEIVACTANYGHDYPFGPNRYVESSRIMWSFMKAHPKQ